MTVDLKDKYISSLQCIAEMQEEIMNHKKRIAEFERLSKRMKPTLDEMIQVDIIDTMIQTEVEPDTSDQTVIMSSTGEPEEESVAQGENETVLQDHMDFSIEELDAPSVEEPKYQSIEEPLDQSNEVEMDHSMEDPTLQSVEEQMDQGERKPQITTVPELLEKISDEFTKSILLESLKEYSMVF